MRYWQSVFVLMSAFLLGCAQLTPAPEQEAPPTEEEAAVSEPETPFVVSREQTLLGYPLRFYLDQPYAENDNPRQTLDIFIPERPRHMPLPVVVLLHPGEWQRGSKAALDSHWLPWVKSGEYAAVTVAYRLTDEASWPAQLHDVKAAIRYVRARADDYGLDSNRIALWGQGAGAHLALMAGITHRASDMSGRLGRYTYIRDDVAAVVNYAGVADINALTEQTDRVQSTDRSNPESLLLGGALADNRDVASAASPIHYIRPGTPPILTLHGLDDRHTPYAQAESLHAALQEAGNTSYLVGMLGEQRRQPPEAAEQRVRDFLDRYLLGKNVNVDTDTIED